MTRPEVRAARESARSIVQNGRSDKMQTRIGLKCGIAAAAFAAFALPFHLNIVVAIAAAVAIGVLVDHFSPPAAAQGAAAGDAR